jgi:hypothetical protein
LTGADEVLAVAVVTHVPPSEVATIVERRGRIVPDVYRPEINTNTNSYPFKKVLRTAMAFLAHPKTREKARPWSSHLDMRLTDVDEAI